MKFVIRLGYSLFRFLWWVFNLLFFKELGKKSYIKNPILLTKKYIKLGENVWILNNSRIEGIVQYNDKLFEPHIIINKHVTIQQNLHLTCAKEVYIGEYTAIASNVTITDIHHSYEDVNIPIELQDIKVDPVFIGEECKIYNNVVILPGTKIGKHCTIGANSVVSGEFPAFCVIAGIPAKIKRKYNFYSNQWEKI